MSAKQPVHENYLKELEIRGFQSDPAQLRAIDALEHCATEWTAWDEAGAPTVGDELLHRLAHQRPQTQRLALEVLALAGLDAGQVPGGHRLPAPGVLRQHLLGGHRGAEFHLHARLVHLPLFVAPFADVQGTA